MSANLDLVRSIYADHEHGDFSSAEWAHPEIEYVIADGPSPGRWTGAKAMAAAWRDFLGAWKDLRVDVEEYRELDDGRVLALTRASARGTTSELQLPESWTSGAALWHIRDGRVTRHVLYLDRERAFADLGLAPEAG